MIAIGIDGCRGGWVAVALSRGRFAGAAVAPELGDVVARLGGEPTIIAVDIPIGLPAIDGGGVRRCDIEARRILGRRGTSVFAAPPLEVLETDTYAAANSLAKERWGRGISTQAYNLRAKILEARNWIDAGGLAREVHPELSFVAMNDMEPLGDSKKSWGGVEERRALLKANGVVVSNLPDDVAAIPVDDVLDAAAAAWSATRIARGPSECVSLPLDARPGEPTITF